MSSPLIETLVENAKYMPQEDDASGSGQPSKCEVECQPQQAALVACMNSIRDDRENNRSDTDDNGNANACLAPSVAAWTECCTLANANGN